MPHGAQMPWPCFLTQTPVKTSYNEFTGRRTVEEQGHCLWLCRYCLDLCNWKSVCKAATSFIVQGDLTTQVSIRRWIVMGRTSTAFSGCMIQEPGCLAPSHTCPTEDINHPSSGFLPMCSSLLSFINWQEKSQQAKPCCYIPLSKTYLFVFRHLGC